jgi:peptide/nickel transport system substrate-binding protein
LPEQNYWTSVIGRRASRRSVLRTGGVLGAGLTGAALIGCGDDDPEPAATPAAPGATPAAPAATPAPTDDGDGPQQGGTLGMFSGIPQDNFNPIVNTGDANSLTAWHVYDRPLIASLEDPGYRLQAAESVEVPDDLTVIIQLKEGMVYQDRAPVNGRPVLSEDIGIVHEYARDEERTIDATFQRVSLDYTETPDDRTIIFHLKQPNGYLFTGTQLGWPHNNCIIPRELVEGDLDNTEPVGSGPYMLDSYQFGVRYEFVRNPTWREADEGKPYIDRRVRIPLNDSAAIEAAFRGHQVHVFGGGSGGAAPTADMTERLLRDMGDQIEATEFTALNLFTWNMASSQDYFWDERVREAFYRNYDADQMIELVGNGFGVKVTGKVAQGLTPYVLDESESAEFLRHDRDEARALLDAAGFDFERVYVNSTLSSPTNNTAAEVFSEQLRQIGVQTTIDSRPASEWLPEVSRTGNYDFCGGVGHPAYDAPGRAMRLHHTNSETHHQAFNIRDPEIDAMIEEAERTVDREANIALVKDIQRDLLRKYAHLNYVYTAIQHELKWADVRDWEFSRTNAVMYRTEAWLDA